MLPSYLGGSFSPFNNPSKSLYSCFPEVDISPRGPRVKPPTLERCGKHRWSAQLPPQRKPEKSPSLNLRGESERATQRSKLRGDKDVDGGKGEVSGAMRKMQTATEEQRKGWNERWVWKKRAVVAQVCFISDAMSRQVEWVLIKSGRERNTWASVTAFAPVWVKPRTRRDQFKKGQCPQQNSKHTYLTYLALFCVFFLIVMPSQWGLGIKRSGHHLP